VVGGVRGHGNEETGDRAIFENGQETISKRALALGRAKRNFELRRSRFFFPVVGA